MGGTDPMETPTPDGEDSPCIGADAAPEYIVVQADTTSGPEADEVYGSRW